MVFLVFIIFAICSFSEICDPKDERAIFSQCINDQMSATFFWNKSNCENANHHAIHNINCTFNCEPGKYIGINSSYSVACLDCPNNTYSTGNLLRFSENDLNFDQIKKFIQVECKWINNEGEIISNNDCISWQPSMNNSKLQVGGYNGTSEVIFDGFMHLKLINDGYILFRYQKKFSQDDEFSNSQFVFAIDEQIQLIDDYGTDKEWHLKNFTLSQGNHEINFGFYSHNYILNISNVLSINLIEISGISHPVFSCTSCPFGFSEPGSSVCTRCAEDEYLPTAQDTKCSSCPIDSFSLPGTFGSSSCIPRPHCSLFDYNVSIGSCTDGIKEINVNPLPGKYFCIHNDSPSSYQSKCGICNPGYSFENNLCKPCPNGTSSQGNNFCTKCPINTYSSKTIDLRYFDNFPNFVSTSCINHNININACKNFQGWKIFNNSFVTTPNLVSQASLILTFDLVINNTEGKMEFVYESNCTSSAHFYIILNKIRSNLPMPINHTRLHSVPLNSGPQKVSIFFYSDDQLASCVNKISEIKISETDQGVGTECKKCPLGFYSDEGSTSCLNCPVGKQRKNSSLSISCFHCPANYFRDSTMPECQECPKHTKPNSNQDSCVLYEIYNLDNKFAFNAFKFEADDTFTIDSISRYYTSEGFFGPVFLGYEESIIYISPMTSKNFSIEAYEYEKEEGNLDPNSYIFGLLHLEVNLSSLNPYNSNYSINPSHFRILKSLGSEIKEVRFTNSKNKTAIIEYINGDSCIEDSSLNYTTTISFICNKLKNHFRPSIVNSGKCHFEIEWESPFACSECQLDQTIKYNTSCNQGLKYTYLEVDDAKSNCIILNELDGDLSVEKVNSLLPSNYVLHFNYSNSSIDEKDLNNIENLFLYYDTIIFSCSEIEVSLIIILSFLGLGLIVLTVAIICACIARKYRFNYRLLKEEVDGIRPSVGGSNNIEMVGKDSPT